MNPLLEEEDNAESTPAVVVNDYNLDDIVRSGYDVGAKGEGEVKKA